MLEVSKPLCRRRQGVVLTRSGRPVQPVRGTRVLSCSQIAVEANQRALAQKGLNGDDDPLWGVNGTVPGRVTDFSLIFQGFLLGRDLRTDCS